MYILIIFNLKYFDPMHDMVADILTPVGLISPESESEKDILGSFPRKRPIKK